MTLTQKLKKLVKIKKIVISGSWKANLSPKFKCNVTTSKLLHQSSFINMRKNMSFISLFQPKFLTTFITGKLFSAIVEVVVVLVVVVVVVVVVVIVVVVDVC